MSGAEWVYKIGNITAWVIGVGMPVELAAADFYHQAPTARAVARKGISRHLGHCDLL